MHIKAIILQWKLQNNNNKLLFIMTTPKNIKGQPWDMLNI